MPKQISSDELEHIEKFILPHPSGVSLTQLHQAIGLTISRSTLTRRLASLVEKGRVERRGVGRATRYFAGQSTVLGPKFTRTEASGQFETPDGIVTITLQSQARDQLEYVSRPPASRRPCGYQSRFLDEYVPNIAAYLPDKLKVHLHKIGRPIQAERAAGTFARDILNRFLIDLSWASSRLEGNTYSRLDTERLIQFGEQAAGKDARETQMILNHKAAIELLVEPDSDQVGINRFTLLNLHALLSDNLMADPEASGRLRRRPVDIGGSVYTPTAIPQVVDELFSEIIRKAAAIGDPFEQAFFITVHLPYLQPFEDVNKRVARLAANIPLIRGNFCPLSYVDVPERAYIAGYLAVYEMTRVELLRDVFVWAYERSCHRYVVIRDSVAEPDLFRLKYRNALIEVIGGIVRQRKKLSEPTIQELALPVVEASDLPRFVDLVREEFARLDEGNIARYRIRLADYQSWNRM